jgi:hypothetical protein
VFAEWRFTSVQLIHLDDFRTSCLYLLHFFGFSEFMTESTIGPTWIPGDFVRSPGGKVPNRETPGETGRLGIRSALQFQIQVSDSDSDSYSDLNMKPGYKMSNCSVSFHGINVIRQGHPSSDYCAFDKAIVQFLADNVKPGKIAETTRPTREFLLRHVCLDLSTNLYFTVYRKIRVYFPNFRKTFISTL